MTLHTLRVPFIMETICFVICGIIVVAASMKEKPTTLLRTLATAGQIQEHQLEDRAIGNTGRGYNMDRRGKKVSGDTRTGKCFDDDWKWLGGVADWIQIKDINNDACEKYIRVIGESTGCGEHDTTSPYDFIANSMCCICLGGKTDSCARRTKKSPCYEIDNRSNCLTTTESREKINIGSTKNPSWLQLKGTPCTWCPEGCSGTANKCEPRRWLEWKNGGKSGVSTIEECLPNEWYKRSLVAHEGPTMTCNNDNCQRQGGKGTKFGNSADENKGHHKKTLALCKIWCDETAGCNSFAWRSEGDCYLKGKCLTEEDEPYRGPDIGFNSYYKPCRTPGDWIERTLVKDEGKKIPSNTLMDGSNIFRAYPKDPLNGCKSLCSQTTGCKSFAYGSGGCWLKDKCVAWDAEKKEVGDYKTYYKPC